MICNSFRIGQAQEKKQQSQHADMQPPFSFPDFFLQFHIHKSIPNICERLEFARTSSRKNDLLNNQFASRTFVYCPVVFLSI